MKPYYQDEYTTIYNASSEEVRIADVIVLDPPHYLDNVTDFKAKTIFLFCADAISYIRQLPEEKLHLVSCVKHLVATPEPELFQDYVLVIGETQLRTRIVTHTMPPLEMRLHEWERPVDLLWLLLRGTDGFILDPYMGSGSTLVAGKLLKRKCVGYEIEKKYCQIAADRLKAMG